MITVTFHIVDWRHLLIYSKTVTPIQTKIFLLDSPQWIEWNGCRKSENISKNTKKMLDEVHSKTIIATRENWDQNFILFSENKFISIQPRSAPQACHECERSEHVLSEAKPWLVWFIISLKYRKFLLLVSEYWFYYGTRVPMEERGRRFVLVIIEKLY